MRKVSIGRLKVGTTPHFDYTETKTPQWNERFRADVAIETSTLDIDVSYRQSWREIIRH